MKFRVKLNEFGKNRTHLNKIINYTSVYCHSERSRGIYNFFRFLRSAYAPVEMTKGLYAPGE